MERLDIPFEYYYNEFCCGDYELIPKEKFSRYIEMAWREIIPLCRTECPENAENALRQAVCLVAEEMCIRETDGAAVRETIDGYTIERAEKPPLSKVICEIVVKMLGDFGVLYAGVEE